MKIRNAPFPIDGMDTKHVMFVIEYLRNGHKATAASEHIGFAPDTGHKLLQRDDVQKAITVALLEMYNAEIDAAWLLKEAVNNHYVARQMGNLPASNAALNLIAKHASVDAFAAEKLELASNEQIRERLARARKRREARDHDQEDEATEISFM